MSPWEFSMYWAALRLPKPPKEDSINALSRWVDAEDDLADDEEREFEPNPMAEDKHLLFFPQYQKN